MSRIIISCGNLLHHLEAAQKKMNTSYNVVELDTELHSEPERLRRTLFDTMENLEPATDTVLLAMGLCGGSVSDIPLPRNIVIPKVDDCITLLMHTDDRWYANLKKCGHLYLTDTVDGQLSVPGIRDGLIEKYGEKKGLRVFDMWFKDYKSVDIIDTGVYDCHSSTYLTCAENSASLINCPLAFVPGSNIILEKLVSGRWDSQFIIASAGDVLHKEVFNI